MIYDHHVFQHLPTLTIVHVRPQLRDTAVQYSTHILYMYNFVQKQAIFDKWECFGLEFGVLQFAMLLISFCMIDLFSIFFSQQPSVLYCKIYVPQKIAMCDNP